MFRSYLSLYFFLLDICFIKNTIHSQTTIIPCNTTSNITSNTTISSTTEPIFDIYTIISLIVFSILIILVFIKEIYKCKKKFEKNSVSSIEIK